MITPYEIEEAVKRNRNNQIKYSIENCISGDDFLFVPEPCDDYFEPGMHYDKYVCFVVNKDNYDFIFPFTRKSKKPMVIKNLERTALLRDSDGSRYELPGVYYGKICDNEYVEIWNNNLKSIYTIEGELIGQYDFFNPMDKERLFEVMENGTCRILDEKWNDVSNNHHQLLKQWIQEAEDIRASMEQT